MSKYLANLLSKETIGFKNFINDIEHATGNYRHDLKLSSNLKQLTDIKIKSLGLNPSDTTSEELFFAVNNLVKLHDKFILEKNSLNYDSLTSEAIDKIIANFMEQSNKQTVFSIKTTTARKILITNPPLLTMRLLGYRSKDSMLKNEDLKTLLTIAFYLEDSFWTAKYLELIRNLSVNDFGFGDAKLISLNQVKYKNITKKLVNLSEHNIISHELTGQILIMNLDTKLEVGFAILTYAYLINRLKTIVKFSTFLQNQILNSNFGEILYKLLSDTNSINFYLSKYELSWDSIAELTSYNDDYQDQIDNVILDNNRVNDIKQLDTILIKLDPAFHFWYDTESLGYYKNKKIVSLNLLDACFNFYNKNVAEDCSHVFMEISLNRSLIGRYIDSKISSEQIMNQIKSSDEETNSIQMYKNKVVYS